MGEISFELCDRCKRTENYQNLAMGQFYRQKEVKNPRKTYKCAWCGKEITGHHLYISGKRWSGQFCAERIHEECHSSMFFYCQQCEKTRSLIREWILSGMKEREAEKTDGNQ